MDERPSSKITIRSRTGGDIEDVSVSAIIGEAGLVDLTFFSPRYRSDGDRHAFNDVFITAEALLGEEILDKWIGIIEVRPIPRDNRLLRFFKPSLDVHYNTVSLEHLKSTLDTLIAGIRDQLPSQPCHTWVDGAKWTMLTLKPKELSDYLRQQDLFVAKTPLLNMWKAAHNEGRFYSERFSRCGETFCYLKLDGSQGLSVESFKDKSEIEDALDAILMSNRLGCVIGGGTGRRYSYIDLALIDLRQGIDAIRRVLVEGKIPKRSWIQFFDSTLAQEWVGIYDDSPPPPMEST